MTGESFGRDEDLKHKDVYDRGVRCLEIRAEFSSVSSSFCRFSPTNRMQTTRYL